VRFILSWRESELSY